MYGFLSTAHLRNCPASNSDTGKQANAHAENIPIATVVAVLGDVECNTLPSATNPEYRAGETHSEVTVDTVETNVTASPVLSNSDVTTRNTSRIRLQNKLGRQPYGLQCPHCHRETITIIEDRIGIGTIIGTVIIAILFWPLCWLPFCVPACKRTYHFCGHEACGKKIGVTDMCG